MIRLSIILAALSALLASALIITLFVTALLHWEQGFFISLIFIACMTALFASLPVGMITPWNSPLMLLTGTLAPAGHRQHRGDQTVRARQRLHPGPGRLIIEAGFPPGVVNVVSGNGQLTGEALTAIPVLPSTCSPPAAPIPDDGLPGNAANNLVPCQMELGGKSPACGVCRCRYR